MKKVFIFACAIVACATLNAKPTAQQAVKAQHVNFTKQVVAQKELAKECIEVTDFRAVKKAANEAVVDTFTNGYFIDGTEWHTGTPTSGLGYVTPARIYVPNYVDSVTLNPIWVTGQKSVWWLDEDPVAEDTAFTIETPDGIGSSYPLPMISTPDFVIEDTTIRFTDWTFGKTFNDQYAQYGFASTLNITADFSTTITQAQYFAEIGEEEGWLPGLSYATVGAGELGDYSYGTHLKNPYNDNQTEIDTIFSIIYNDGTMYIEKILVDVWTRGDAIMGDKDKVSLGIFKVEDNVIDFTKPLYTATATKEDNFIPVEEGTSWIGSLAFVFVEEDEFGGLSEVPAIIEGDFVVALYDFNDGEENFGILSDYFENSIVPNSYFICYNKEKGKNVITQLWMEPSSLNISFAGIHPQIVGLPETVEFDKEGGEKSFVLQTNVEPQWMEWPEDLQFVAFDTIVEYVEDEGDLYFNYRFTLKLSADANDNYRTEDFVIDALGKTYTIAIKQGEEPTALEETLIENNNVAKYFDGKQIVIRKGNKRVNVLGTEL